MVPERRTVLASLAGLCSLGVAGCSAFDVTSETATETAGLPSRSTPTSAAQTTPESPTTTLTPEESDTSTATTPDFVADAGDSRYFGGSVGIAGDTAVVGARGTGSDAGGVAYVFVRSNGSWRKQATLAPDTDDASFARLPVAVSGHNVLVGHHLYARADGSWIRERTLVPDVDVSLEIREISIAVDDDTAVVGNPNHGSEGRAYVFHRSGESWSHRVTLGSPDGEWGAGFGSAVSIDGDTLVVGSPSDETSNETNAGSAHVFTRQRGTWDEQATLTVDDGGDGLFFRSLSLSGDTVLVGTDGDEDPGDDRSGSAYVFERTDGDWRQRVRVVPTVESRDSWLGHYGDEVALAGDVALLSGAWSPTPQIQDGVESVHLFSRDGDSWSQTRTLVPENEDAGDKLGPVALTGDAALVGAPMERRNDDSEGRGVAYVYRLR